MRSGSVAGSRPVRVLVAAFAALTATVVAACAFGNPVVPPSGTPGSPAPTVNVAPLATPTATPPESAAAGVRLDESLLGILPPDVSGVAVQAEGDAMARAAADPDFARTVDAAAFAVVAGPADLASGVVAHLRPGIFNDAFFRDWRDSYSSGVCANAGGVARNAESTIGGRTVYIATCTGGLRVYQTHLPGRDVIVSLLSVGEARYGERLMDGLRP